MFATQYLLYLSEHRVGIIHCFFKLRFAENLITKTILLLISILTGENNAFLKQQQAQYFTTALKKLNCGIHIISKDNK